jgi:membrane protein DedA with SNARE-associated domain
MSAEALLGGLAAYTYPVVFLGILIDASGVPFPGRLLLVAAGASVGSGQVRLAVIIMLATVAAALMDHVWYLAGAWGSRLLLRVSHRLAAWSGVDQRSTRDYFTRYGAATIIIGRFFTSVRALAWPMAAAHGVGYVRFLILDLVAAAGWASLWVILGWMVGERWASAADTAGLWLGVAGVLVIGAAVAPVATRIVRRRLQKGRRVE